MKEAPKEDDEVLTPRMNNEIEFLKPQKECSANS
jgi:hypothetical protein